MVAEKLIYLGNERTICTTTAQPYTKVRLQDRHAHYGARDGSARAWTLKGYSLEHSAMSAHTIRVSRR